MSGNVFFDTNVLIYAYAAYEPLKQTQALAILQAPDARISTQVLIEFGNVYARKLKVAWPGVEAAILEITKELSVHQTATTTVTHATRLAQRYGFSWFDALIVAAALECGCATLYSEDLQHVQVIEHSLAVINPFLP